MDTRVATPYAPHGTREASWEAPAIVFATCAGIMERALAGTAGCTDRRCVCGRLAVISLTSAEVHADPALAVGVLCLLASSGIRDLPCFSLTGRTPESVHARVWPYDAAGRSAPLCALHIDEVLEVHEHVGVHGGRLVSAVSSVALAQAVTHVLTHASLCVLDTTRDHSSAVTAHALDISGGVIALARLRESEGIRTWSRALGCRRCLPATPRACSGLEMGV
jgi:hypothetical protein